MPRNGSEGNPAAAVSAADACNSASVGVRNLRFPPLLLVLQQLQLALAARRGEGPQPRHSATAAAARRAPGALLQQGTCLGQRVLKGARVMHRDVWAGAAAVVEGAGARIHSQRQAAMLLLLH